MKSIFRGAALLIGLIWMLVVIPDANSQRVCPGGICQVPIQIYQRPLVLRQPPVIIQTSPPLVMPSVPFAPASDDDRTETLAAGDTPSVRAACRVRVGNGCGSGSVCGFYKTGSLILTNAHVAGTRLGRICDVDVVVNGKRKNLKASVIMAAYSDRTLTDWAILYVDDWQEIKPVPLSKEKPDGDHYTHGSPRCVWPLVTTGVRTVEVSDSSSLWRWRPNSIAGQSGSGVWSTEDHKQYGLLTWSWAGLGGGQQTSEIWRQAKEQSIEGPPRIPGLEVPEARVDGVVIETGFFQQAGIDELPIWGDLDNSDPPTNPDEFTEEQRRLFARLLDAAAAAGLESDEIVAAIIALLETVRK